MFLICGLCLVFFGCGKEEQQLLNNYKNLGKVDLGGDYYKNRSGVYWQPEDVAFEVKDVDIDTFESLGGSYYAKDKNNVYYADDKIEDADNETFEFLRNGYAKDKNRIYKNGSVLESVDVESFKILDEHAHYFKDKNNVYYKGLHSIEEIKNVDLKSFEVLGKSYSKDKNSIYYETSKLENADIDSFEVFDKYSNYYYAKDKDSCYRNGEIVKMFECDALIK